MSLETQLEIRRNAQFVKSGLKDLHGWLSDVKDQRKFVDKTKVISQASEIKERGNELFNKGMYKEANIAYSDAIEVLSVVPDDKLLRSQILLNRALCALRLGDGNNAVIDCTESFKLSPTPKALYRRSCAEVLLKRPEAARKDILRALKMIPENDKDAKEECEKQLETIAALQRAEVEDKMNARRRKLCTMIPEWCVGDARAPLVDLRIAGVPNFVDSNPLMTPSVVAAPLGTRYIPRSERMFKQARK